MFFRTTSPDSNKNRAVTYIRQFYGLSWSLFLHYKGMNKMKLFVGLGNPGKQYEQTRHNIGFMVVEQLAKKNDVSLDKAKFNGLFGSGVIHSEKVILCKPLTYMNISGECIRPLVDYYQIETNDIYVIYDDLDLPFGKLRLREKGSAGGHNGMKSLIHHLGTQQFNRIRIGIGRSKFQGVSDHVLSKFNEEENTHIQEAIQHSVSACEEAVNSPFIQIMNKFNVK